MLSAGARRLLILLAVGASCAATASPAQAVFGPAGLAVTPSTTQAAAPADVRVQLSFTDPSADVKTLRVHLPAGLLGNPQATPRCPKATFDSGSCPSNTIVGSVTAKVDTNFITGVLDVPGTVASIAPSGNEPARLGIKLTPVGGLLGDLRLEAPVTLRPDDLGLDATLSDLPRKFSILPNIDIQALDLTLNARAGSPLRPFIVLPTRCTPATTRVEADSYAAPGTFTSAQASFTATGCGAVPFTPGLALTPPSLPADQPGGLALSLTVPTAEEPVRQSHVRSASVVLPEGVVLSPGVTAGLASCSDATAASPAGCPAASQVGDVRFATPLLGELTGQVFLAAQTADRLLGLQVRIDPGGLDVRLPGAVQADPATGRLTARFDELPQIPFSAFTLGFRGGEQAVLRSPTACGETTAQATLEPWSGGPAATATATLTTTDCPPSAFAPSLALSAGPDRLSVAIDRPDGQARLRALRVVLPPGVAGRLGGVPTCAVAAAQAGGCPASSRLGGVRVLVGTGPAPVALTGEAFLAPPTDGALAGLAIVLPARVGPLDLGTVVVLGRLDLTPDLRVAVRFDALPQSVAGIPLDLRRLELTLDRPGFATQATRCEPLTADGTATAADGRTAPLSAPYSAPGCTGRGLGTTVEATVGPPTRSGTKPPLTVTLRQPDDGANLSAVSVLLPTSLTVDLGALGTTCSEDALKAGTCPAGATIGQATVQTGLIEPPLSGPVRLVTAAKGGLPSLAVDLGLLTLRGTVAFGGKGGQLRASFPVLPDVPLRSLKLAFVGGKAGAFKAARSLCPSGGTLIADLAGQGGQKKVVQAPVRGLGCPTARPRASVRLRGGRRPDLRVDVRTAGSPLRAVKVTLPKSLATVRSRARGARVSAGGRTLKLRPKLTRRTVTVRGLPRKGSRRVVVRVRKGALRRTRSLRRGKAVTLRVRTVDAAGKARTLRVRARVR